MKTKSIKKNILLLAIETSCDDTSISIFKNDKMLSLATLSTIKQFKKYGGIVPEIAARGHEESLIKVYLQAIKKAKIKPQELDYIAYTSEPGLPGSLHVGKTFAKALGFLLGIECVPINHMLGHVFSFAINDANKIKFPFICLVASGGHTTLYLFNGIEDYKILNETTDDPIGETLDKIGRMLKLEYPGGISIDTQYKPDKNNLKLIGHHSPQTNFSFSGLKTHILNQINTLNMKNKDIDKVLIGSSCLKWIIDDVFKKIDYYSQIYNVKNIVIGGGVSANSLLRKRLYESDYIPFIPEMQFTGDNGAMIGFYAYLKVINNR